MFKQAGRPVSRTEILQALGVGKSGKQALRGILKELLNTGKVVRTKHRLFILAENMATLIGRLEVQRSGVGFVLPEDKRHRDIFIHPSRFADAWHGDKVVVSILPVIKKRGKKVSPEGHIVRVLERRQEILPVRVQQKLAKDLYQSIPTDPRLQFTVVLDGRDITQKPVPGDIIMASAGKQLEPKLWEARAVEYIGQEHLVDVQEHLVKTAYGIRQKFSDKALAQAKELPDIPQPEDYANRTDLTSLSLVTIDGETAKDFDDAIHVKTEKNGWLLTVAIADVSHYVSYGSSLDREAQQRGNSYYFPHSVEPMFPKTLSNGLCSLNPDVPRLAMVVEIPFSPEGTPGNEKIYPAVIKSHARLTYTQVQAAFSGDEKEQEKLGFLWPVLEQAKTLARVLRKRRLQRGSLDFDLPEAHIIFTETREIQGIEPAPRVFAHMLIEEFMVAANEAVARFLLEKKLPCPYRIHHAPDMDKLKNAWKILATAGVLTDKVPAEITPKEVQHMLTAAQDTPLEYMAGRLVLRSMKQAVYHPENQGHFGLASKAYTHFTSPIRRYADLLVHRSVKKALYPEKGPLPQQKIMAVLCEAITTRERIAMEAEREIKQRLTLIFLADKIGQKFTGTVNGVSDYGFWVELAEVMAEGMVPLSGLDDDYYHFLPERQEILGINTGQKFSLGQEVRVCLAHVSLSRLEVELELQKD